jgi:uncharacterized protein YbaP (TraB family)
MKGTMRRASAALFAISLMLILLSCAGGAAVLDDAGQIAASEADTTARESIDYPGKTDGELFFWRLERDGRKIHILGSVHLATEDLYPLDERIISAFAVSDLLVEEVDLVESNSLEAQNFIAERSALPPGDSIGNYLSAEEIITLTGILDRYGIPSSTVEGLQPWVLANTLTILSSFESGMDPSYGVDIYFASQAMNMGMELYALETAIQQLEYLSGISMEAQLWSLRDTIAQFDDISESMNAILDAWKSGDMYAMEELMLTGFDSPEGREYYQRLLTDRNLLWEQQILELMEKGKSRSPFIVVGTGHLVGPDNLIELLIGEGFSARRF